jgi:pantoate--beta-alanine ligase
MSDRKAPSAVKIVREATALRRAVRAWRKAGESVALVPTMGALHEGHLSLVRLAGEAARRVVVSLFVNRPQFGSEKDFSTYPRSEAADAAKLAATSAALIYAPTMETMYPEGYATTVTVEGPAQDLEGRIRPGHFAAVATVVSKLFIQCAPDIAVFGEKDYQQLLVVRRLVRDLDLPVRILAGPTIREADGLALSSRNAHLSPKERAIAPALYRALAQLAAEVQGARASAIEPACRAARDALLAAGFAQVDYVVVHDAETLSPIERVTAPARALAAARLGHTRLIDNVPVMPR